MSQTTATTTRTRALDDAPGPRRSLYRVFWRWHFYAGVLVSPVLFVVAVTGGLYIFRAEIENWAHRDLRFVTPGPNRAGAEAQVRAVLDAFPGHEPSSLEMSSYPDRASIVSLSRPGGEGDLLAYVDPYTLRVLGSARSDQPDGLARFFDLTLEIHRTLFAGLPGRVVVELTVGWTILLLFSGLYLWWPRRANGGSQGAWWPRLKAKPYTVLRDLHNVFGFYLLVPAIIMSVTGLFYTPVWSVGFYVAYNQRLSPPEEPPTLEAGEPAAFPTDRLDQIEARARRLYPGRSHTISLKSAPGGGVQVFSANDYNNSWGEYVSADDVIDPADGRVISHTSLDRNDLYWWHGWTYPLHVGSVLGTATKVLWLVGCVVLAALPVTGLWMWWVRRPTGRTGFPRRPDRPIPPSLVALIAGLGVLLPLAGLSMVLILAGEYLLLLLHRRKWTD